MGINENGLTNWKGWLYGYNKIQIYKLSPSRDTRLSVYAESLDYVFRDET